MMLMTMMTIVIKLCQDHQGILELLGLLDRRVSQAAPDIQDQQAKPVTLEHKDCLDQKEKWDHLDRLDTEENEVKLVQWAQQVRHHYNYKHSAITLMVMQYLQKVTLRAQTLTIGIYAIIYLFIFY